MKYYLTLPMTLIAASIIFISCQSECCKSDQQPKKITVIGSAETEVIPDEIYMSFTLREYLNDTKQKVDLEQIKSRFLKTCAESGVADSNVVISSYTGYERWDYYYYRKRRMEPDFMASITYTIKAPSADVMDKVVATLDDKALDNFFISKTSYSKMEELRKEVKIRALKASQEKAKYLAESIGEEVGEAILIQEIDNSYVSDFAESNAGLLKAAEADQSAPFDTGKNFARIKVRYEMNCEFALK